MGGDTVDIDTVGIYVITYNVVDSDGNAADQVTRTVTVVSNEPPVITLNGSASVSLTVGDTFTDPGATASDPEDGDISDRIVVGGDSVDTSVAGTYVITYNVTDSDGNSAAEVTRTVEVRRDSPAPIRSGGGPVGPAGLGLLALLALLRVFVRRAG